jgi:pyruvate/2-oxoglutarate dehydrogenase complex dihydrolipoamide dehydrogenase (E3) component
MPSLVILGAGPAGNTCASVAATLGADVTLVERDIVGGAAHLWDCIPSKALIATGGVQRGCRLARLATHVRFPEPDSILAPRRLRPLPASTSAPAWPIAY